MALLQYPRTRTPISLVAPAQDIALHPSCSSSFKPPVAMPPPPSALCAAQRAREAPAGNDSKARLGWCKTVAFSHRPNTSNGSAFPFRPDDHSENPTDDESEFAGHDKVGESTVTGAHPQSQNTADSARDAERGTFQGADKERTLRQDRDRGSPSFGKEIAERFRDKSHQSLEGANESMEREVDKSLISFEGNLKDVNGKPNQQEGNATADTDSLWRTVFPAYMRSKDDESHDEQCSNSLSESPNRGRSHGVHGAAAARAAAAAAASARELESHVNSFMNPSLSPSISAPPCSSARLPTEGGKNLRDLISDDPIWAAIRAEARLEAEREPLLSSFLYASILAHPCFERSLGFVLANRLKNATLLATQLMDVLDDVFMYDADLCQAIRLDVQAVKDRDPSCRSYSSALLYLKGYHALQSYRVAHVLWNRGQMVLALALQSRISEVFAVDIHPAARIGKAILLDHGTGVVIGETAVVGDRVSMLQGVTLGGTGKVAGDRHPKIGEGVLIGAGATILGNIVVGRGAMVAAGSLVLKDVPPHSMVAGTPAKVIGVLEEPTPSLTMKHDATKKFCQSVAEDSWYEGAGI